MREIKFRAWDKYGQKMHSLEKTEVLMSLEGWKSERYLWLQFTGLHDKNGKEIFEGDILKCELSEVPFNSGDPKMVKGVVEYQETFGYWVVDFPLWGVSMGFYELAEEYLAELEVIGNEHEAPQLCL